MGLLDTLFGRRSTATSGRDQATARAAESAPPAKVAKPNEHHYLLSCRECGFTHHIPRDCYVPPAAFSVHVDDARIQYVYGGVFTVTLTVGAFFTVAPAGAGASGRRELHASIADNMKVLHGHILSHCDPVFLVIQQSPGRTTHEYKRQPEGPTYVKLSKDRGVDIVGRIDASKAEIPGVSW